MCEFVIDTNEILKNLQKTKNKLNTGTKICGVVKANAYGFGLGEIYELIKDKVDYFAVARLNEFLDLKRLGNIKPCLILSPLYVEELKTALQDGAEITISTNSDIVLIDKIAKNLNKKAKVHIKVDTGMNRFGYNDFSLLRKVLKKIKLLENIEVVGLFSHFYDTQSKEVVLKQRSKFIFFKKLVNKFGFNPICHLSSSKGIIDKQNQFNMVRLGFDLYHSNKHELVSKVLEIKNIKKDESVGYSGKFVANKDLEIAVCEGGYADGILRRLDKSYVLINGEKCKIIGNICMDSFMAIVPKNKVKVNDKVTIFGKNQEKFISVCDIAKLCDTIPYEIYLNISNRVKRVYV